MTPTLTEAYNNSAPSKQDLLPAGIAMAAIIGATAVAAVIIKKRQPPSEEQEQTGDDFEFI